MSPERSQAYRRVMHTLDELGPSKLLDEEQDRIRRAADNLIFASDMEDTEGPAQAALDDTVRLCRFLVDSGRWEKVTAAQLGSDLRACGPETVAGLRAA